MFELPILSYLNLKILNYKIFNHQLLAIYINCFCLIYKIVTFIILIFFSSAKIYKEYCNNPWLIFIGIFFYFLIMIPRAYAITKLKVLMDIKYISPYKILIIFGIIGTIISTAVGIISSFIKCGSIESYDIYFCNIKKKDTDETYFENIPLYWETITEGTNYFFIEMLLFLIGIITNFIFQLFYVIVIKILTPIHIIFLNLTYTFFLRIIASFSAMIKGKKEGNSINNVILSILLIIFEIIINAIVIFALLVYLEIIELKFCNYNYNLRENIIQRSLEEYELNKVPSISKNIDEEEENNLEENN